MDEENKESKIKIFSSDDEKLKKLGELLSNQSSRNIIKLLTNNEMYKNEIADKLDLRVNLVIHHLKKMEELGLVEVTTKPIAKKGNDHRYFRMKPGIFLVPNQTKEEIDKSGFLKRIFRDGIKLFTFTMAVFSSSFLFQNYHKLDNYPKPNLQTNEIGRFFTQEMTISIIITCIFVITSIILLKKRRKR